MLDPVHLEHLLLQSPSTDDLSTMNSKKCEYCSDYQYSEDDDILSGCVHCMSLPNRNTLMSEWNSRSMERNERLQIKLARRTNCSESIQTTKSIITKKSKTKPIDQNIDELVKFIDGDQQSANKESKSKKNKKKKGKGNVPTIPSTEITKDEVEIPITRRSSTPSIISEKTSSIQSNTNSPSRSVSPSQEEQINWITISRKTTKQKTTNTIPSKRQGKNTSQQQSQKTNPVPHPQKNLIKSTVNSSTSTSHQKPQEKPSTISQPPSTSTTNNSSKKTASCWKNNNNTVDQQGISMINVLICSHSLCVFFSSFNQLIPSNLNPHY